MPKIISASAPSASGSKGGGSMEGPDGGGGALVAPLASIPL